MPSDYAAITQENIRRRGEEFEDIGNFLAEKLYGDRSHFIYELLQNAEDALSRRREKNPDAQFLAMSLFAFSGTILKLRTMGNPSMATMYAGSATFCAAPKPNGSIELAHSALDSNPYTPLRARPRFTPETNIS